MRKVKKRLKVIPMFTIFEKRKALDARRYIEKSGLDPLKMTIQSTSGMSSFNYINIAHYFEMTGSSFDMVKTNFKLEKRGDTHERRRSYDKDVRKPRTKANG